MKILVNVDQIHSLIQEAIDTYNVRLDQRGPYVLDEDNACCLLGALSIGLRGVKRWTPFFNIRPLADSLGIRPLDLELMEAGFCAWPWQKRENDPWYKLGVELRNTYV